MRLSAEPPRIIRLSPKVIFGVAAAFAISSGVLVYALQTLVLGADGQECYSSANQQPVDGLAGLLRDYTG